MKSAEAVDVGTAIITSRAIPCLCVREERTGTISISTGRGITVEQVECRGCWRTYRRFDHT
jgi:hypothetical protein